MEWPDEECFFDSPGISTPTPAPIGQTENEPPPEKRARIGSFVQTKNESLHEASLGPLEFYTRQRHAIPRREELSKRYKNPRIFSQEFAEDGGGRRYIVTTLERFWYWHEHGALHNLYELIEPENPCRLYFDLEYLKKVNTGVSEKQVYEYFISTTIATIKELYGIDASREDFLALDSSNETKFSCHLIVHLKGGYLFPNNVAIRGFIEILKQRLLNEPPQRLFDEDGREIVIFDEAVYSRYRNFRLFKSSKLGQKRPLLRSSYCSFYTKKIVKDEQIFFDSLCVPANLSSSEKLLPTLQPSSTIAKTGSAKCLGRAPLSNIENTQEGLGTSPYPELEGFLLRFLQRWKEDVYMRQWKVAVDKAKNVCITFYPANCRYCFNVGRQHKSNTQFWTVNLHRGDMVQRCFDPTCRGFTSNYFPVTKAVIDSTKRYFGEDEAESKKDPFDLLLGDEAEVVPSLTQWNGVFDE